MAIKFLKNHEVAGSIPVEKFTVGQVVEDRSPESEAHFVSRGVAAYVRDKKLYDRDGKEVDEKAITTVVVNTSDNRDEPASNGKLPDGTPQRASSGPGEVMTTTVVNEGEAEKAKPASKSKK